MQTTDREILRLAVPAFLALVAEPLFLLTDAASFVTGSSHAVDGGFLAGRVPPHRPNL